MSHVPLLLKPTLPILGEGPLSSWVRHLGLPQDPHPPPPRGVFWEWCLELDTTLPNLPNSLCNPQVTGCLVLEGWEKGPCIPQWRARIIKMKATFIELDSVHRHYHHMSSGQPRGSVTLGPLYGWGNRAHAITGSDQTTGLLKRAKLACKPISLRPSFFYVLCCYPFLHHMLFLFPSLSLCIAILSGWWVLLYSVL